MKTRTRRVLARALLAMVVVAAPRAHDAAAQPAPVMVGDHTHGIGSSDIQSLANANGRLVFGPGLGFSDGTPAGTEWPAPCSGQMDSPLEIGGLVYFVDRGSSRPYRTDGTCAGTYQLANNGVIWPGVYPGPAPFAAVGSHVFFFGSQGLWRTDGTPEGTTLLRTFSPAEGQPLFAAAGQTRLYFETDAADGTATLWTSDGTAQGTIPVTSFVDGANDVWAHRWPRSFAAVGDRAFFAMYTPAEGVELWTSDGTPGGTALVADLQPGAASSDPIGLIAFQGRLAFVAWGAGALVYTSDGTAAHTAPIHPSFTANFVIGPPLFTVGGKLVATWGFQFLASDGTQGVPPVVLGPWSDYGVRVAGTVAYYSADDGVHGHELWQTDGTPAGTHLVVDLCPGACDGQRTVFDVPVAPVGGALFFAGNDGVHGTELWRIGLPTPGPLPSARTDAYSVSAGATLTVPASGVLANDEDNGTGALTTALVTPPGQGALTFGADGGFTFTAPPTPGTVSFTYRALNANGTSAPARVLITVLPVPPVAVDDQYTTAFNTTLTVAAPGVLANDIAHGNVATVQLMSVPSAGALTLSSDGAFRYVPMAGFIGTVSFTYQAGTVDGQGNVATATITVGAPTTVQPPRALVVESMVGTSATLRWLPPTSGPAPTSWIFEGGVDAGQALVSFPTGSLAPRFTLTAPPGSYYVRVRAVDGAGISGPSNEVRVFIAQPLPPAAPTGLLGLAHGSALSLAWQPSYARGDVSSFVLDVSGALSTTVPLGTADTFAFDGVPPGTYTFAVRALNTFGSSPASSPITLTFPTACSGAPSAPANLIADVVGNVVRLGWDLPPSGSTPTSYLLDVTGAVNGTVPMVARTFSSPAPAGTYTFSVRAVNVCGTSAPSASVTRTVP